MNTREERSGSSKDDYFRGSLDTYDMRLGEVVPVGWTIIGEGLLEGLVMICLGYYYYIS